MPLLMCPNDDAPMQTLERSGVQFDMCPTCRGVWLDRGELEKLMSAAASDGSPTSMAHPTQAPSPYPAREAQSQPWGSSSGGDDRDYRRDHDRGDRKYDDRQYKKKKKFDSIFDIFD